MEIHKLNMKEEIHYDWGEEEYIEESRCVRCEQETSWEEDINNLGMCDCCHKQSILFSYE